MQEDNPRSMLDQTLSSTGSDRVNSAVWMRLIAANPLNNTNTFHPVNPILKVFPVLLQTKGWLGKALEFINSGPPALLNNPPCSMRVVYFSYFKHAMEVHYG